MPASPADLFAAFDRLEIAHETVKHQPIFTVEEGRSIKATMPGGHTKNLFLRDKKGGLTLACAHADTRVDLTGLGKALGARGRYSFAKPALMRAVLGVEPGSVTPFSLINAAAPALACVALDKALMGFDRVWFHPLENTASTAVRPADLVRFIVDCGFQPQVLSLSAPLETL